MQTLRIISKAALLVAAICVGTSVFGQSTPTTVFVGSVYIGGGNATIGGQSGTLTDATGNQGTNPGYTWFRYGQANGGGGSFVIDSTSGSSASLKYFTATSAAPAVSAPATNFATTTAYSWEIISPNTNSTSRLLVRASDGTPVDLTTGAGALPLDNTSNLAAYNTRLNAIYKFDKSSFIDPNTNAPIATGVGIFAYSFSGFNGSTYRSISLTYTPIPEPVTVGLVAFGLLAGLGAVRRLRATKLPVFVAS